VPSLFEAGDFLPLHFGISQRRLTNASLDARIPQASCCACWREQSDNPIANITINLNFIMMERLPKEKRNPPE